MHAFFRHYMQCIECRFSYCQCPSRYIYTTLPHQDSIYDEMSHAMMIMMEELVIFSCFILIISLHILQHFIYWDINSTFHVKILQWFDWRSKSVQRQWNKLKCNRIDFSLTTEIIVLFLQLKIHLLKMSRFSSNV